MPLYDVKCASCGAEKEIRLSAFDSEMPKCPCGGEQERLLCAPGAYVMNGGGTYDSGFVSAKKGPK